MRKKYRKALKGMDIEIRRLGAETKSLSVLIADRDNSHTKAIAVLKESIIKLEKAMSLLVANQKEERVGIKKILEKCLDKCSDRKEQTDEVAMDEAEGKDSGDSSRTPDVGRRAGFYNRPN